MRGWSSILVGSGLLAFSAWSFWKGGVSLELMLFLMGGSFLIYRGCRGIGFEGAGNALTLVGFVRNPSATLVDVAIDEAGDWLADKRKTTAPEEPPPFDADAAFARYMANRPEGPPAIVASPAPARGFGRKGL